jgi:spore coat polysaccharide biosynthesis predicted glycosyltransferase SpsG
MMILSDKTLTVQPNVVHLKGRPSLWIRTAAGPQIGYGHLRRCIILAQSLLNCSTPLFLLDSDDRWSQEQLKCHDLDYSCNGLDAAWSLFREPAVILIDTRLTEGLDRWISAAQNRKIPVISIHDLGLDPLSSNIVIDGSIAPAFFSSPSKHAQWFSGTNFTILDPAYRFLTSQKAAIRSRVQSIVINLGGGDSRKYFYRVLEGLKLWAHEVEVIGIRGFIPWGQELVEQMDWNPLHFRWETGSVEQLYFQADLAITAGGLAAYEALCS